MRIRRLILLFGSLVTVLIVLLLLHGQKKPTKSLLTASVETNVAPSSETLVGNSSASTPVQTNILSAKTATGAAISKFLPSNKAKQAIGLLATYNDVAIDFYGKVEDQFSNVVVNAAINFSIRIYNGVESTVKRGQVMTDENGVFSITGYRGQDLGLALQKAGYVPTSSKSGTLFKYSRLEEHPYVSDPNSPVVFGMWKLQGAEPLIAIDKHYRLPFTNGAIDFDLVAGQVVSSGGDLEIKVHRPDGIISQQNPQIWSIDFDIIDGGFIETTPENSAGTFAAPERDYQPHGTFANNNGPDLLDKTFFIQSRKGQVYSKVHLLFRINNKREDFMYVNIQGVANTNSSRNWEATAPR